MALQRTIKELIEFYVKINYEKHLEVNNITCIERADIILVIDKFYDGEERKKHIKTFVLNGLQKMSANGGHCDISKVDTLLDEVMSDNNMVKTRVYNEIVLYQESKQKQ